MEENQETFFIDKHGACRNFVFDDASQSQRPVSETEKKIIRFCFKPSHQYNKACTNLYFAVFEETPFHTNDLRAAAKSIFGKWHRKEKRTKVVDAMLPYLRADGSYEG